MFVISNETINRNWKPEIGCVGKFARVSFDSTELAINCGKAIRNEGYSISEDIRLTGGYPVNKNEPLIARKKFVRKDDSHITNAPEKQQMQSQQRHYDSVFVL